jgi:hypothetical protein
MKLKPLPSKKVIQILERLGFEKSGSAAAMSSSGIPMAGQLLSRFIRGKK